MSKYLTIYDSTATKDQKDGAAITEGSFENPIRFTLNASDEETGYVRLAIRCADNFAANGDVTLKVELNKALAGETGAVDNSDRYALCLDNDYTAETIKTAEFAETLTITGLEDANKLFWLKCNSSKTEEPSIDKACQLKAEGVIKAKEA